MRTRKAMAVLAAAVAATIGMIGVSPAQAAGTVHGCPFGDVCIYPQNTGWNGDHPSVEFYTYGVHNLSNQYGNHYVLNNQYDWTPPGGGYAAGGVIAFTGYNGTGSEAWELMSYIHQSPGHPAWGNFNLTPINSLDLYVMGP